MDFLMGLVDWFRHLDTNMTQLAQTHGAWAYVVFFAIVFCETGLVVTPFLPGDSMLFIAGMIAKEHLNVHLLVLLLIAAAVLGDAVNYYVGKRMGNAVFEKKNSRIFKREYLERTQRFFDKYGNKTIVLARFVPIVRTFAPFLAGVGCMPYRRFFMYNVVGAVVWVAGITYLGYGFADVPAVKSNLSIVVIGIIVLSIMPAVIEIIRARREGSQAPDSVAQ